MPINVQNLLFPTAHFSVNIESKMAEVSSAETPVAKKLDKEFDPSAEMIVNDFDDERTLDEEEALEGSEDPQTELTNLQKEGDMPLEELLAMYGYAETGGDAVASSSSEEEDELMEDNDETQSFVELPAEPYSELQQLYADEIPKASTQEGGAPHSEEEEEEEDGDYKPEDDDEWKKNIMVGPDFQADVPNNLCKYDDALPYENEDKMLWEPLRLVNTQVEEYLVKAHEPFSNNQGVNAVPTGVHIKDDEQALYLLLQCGFNVEEALRRRRMNVVAPTDTMSLWSEEECHNFENGLRIYGKDFHMIQHHKVRTRSVGELVQFYYLWKKTERHDAFANKSRLEKKKYTLHPGITDYMDRLLDEQESGGQTRDRSISPMTQCLLYGDPKRHQRVHEAYGEPGSHTLLSTLSYNSNKPSMRDFTKHLDKDSLDSFLKMAAASALPECHLKDPVESGKCEGRSQPVANAEISHHTSPYNESTV